MGLDTMSWQIVAAIVYLAGLAATKRVIANPEPWLHTN